MKLGTKPPSLHQRGHIGLSTRAKTWHHPSTRFHGINSQIWHCQTALRKFPKLQAGFYFKFKFQAIRNIS
jgi:hypothetical protein